MTDVLVAAPKRALASDSFADITAVAVVAIVNPPDGSDGLLIQFAGVLTAAQVEAVLDRAQSVNSAHEELRRRATAALSANRSYLASTPHTQAEALAQVETLTRQVNSLIRFALGAFDGTE